MERVATQPDGDPHNAGGRQGAASAVLRTVGAQRQAVLVLDGRRFPRKSGRFPWSFFAWAPRPFVTLRASLHARATRPTRCAGRCTRSGSRCALHSAGLPEPDGCGAPGLRPPLRHRESWDSLPLDAKLRSVGGCLAAPPGSSSSSSAGAA